MGSGTEQAHIIVSMPGLLSEDAGLQVSLLPAAGPAAGNEFSFAHASTVPISTFCSIRCKLTAFHYTVILPSLPPGIPLWLLPRTGRGLTAPAGISRSFLSATRNSSGSQPVGRDSHRITDQVFTSQSVTVAKLKL